MSADYDIQGAKLEKEAESKTKGFFKSNTKSGQLFEAAAESYKKGQNSM